MHKLFRTMTWRDIKSNFKQFLSVVVIVLLSVMLLSGFIVNSHSLNGTVETYFDKTNLADVWLNVDKVTDEDELFFAEHEYEYTKRLYIETTGMINAVSAENTSKIYVSDGKVSSPYIESGKKGCLIDKKIAEDLDVTVGIDTFKFVVDVQGVPVELEFRITGTMSHVECANTYSAWPVFIDENLFLEFFNYEIEQSGLPLVFDEIPYNQVLLKTQNAEKLIESLDAYYKLPTTESSLVLAYTRDSVESVVLLESELEQSKKMIYVFPVIFLVVSVLVILTTIDQLVIQEKQRIGTLKSVGISDRKILRHYSSYGAWLCFIGAILGAVLGSIIIPNIMQIKYDLVYSIPFDFVETRVPFLMICTVVLGIILLGYLVSFSTCYKILHKTPIACLKFNVNNSKQFKKNNGKFKKMPFSLKMAIRNIRINPLRTIMATIGIAGCTALLLCGFGVRDTLENSVNNDFGKVFKYDITTTYLSPTFEQDLDENSKIDFYEKFETSYVFASNNKTSYTITMFEIQENSKLSSIKLKANEVCVSKSVAEKLKIKVGDSFTISNGTKSAKLKVSKIVETSLHNGIFVTHNFGVQGQLSVKGVWVKTNNGVSKMKIAEFLNAKNGTKDAVCMSENIDGAYEKVSSIDVMTNTLKVFAILLAVVVLLNIVFLILKERTREIATLKVVGQGVWTIGLAILFEVLFMTIIGSVIGMFLGYPLMVLVLSINKVEVFNFLYYLSPMSFVFTLLITLLTIGLIWLICVNKILKLNMVESLKSIE